jgi:hypothetical protein
MEVADAWHFERGWTEAPEDKNAHLRYPFDKIYRRGGEVKHPEIKGTTCKTAGPTDAGLTFILTRGEVLHAGGHCKAAEKCHSAALFTVTDITLTPLADGSWEATGGKVHPHDSWHLACPEDPWHLANPALVPRTYTYRIPEDL